jgi:hypothetical protein
MTMDKNQKMSDKILCFLYKEMTEDESVEFLNSLEENPFAMQEFLEIQETIESIESFSFSPSDKLLSKVHAYASYSLISPQ